jgi:hypothetical protein
MLKRLMPLLVVFAAMLSLGTASASAEFGFESFNTKYLNHDGSPDLQPGSHPWEMVTEFQLNRTTTAGGQIVSEGDIKDVEDELPAGFIGNPSAVPKCTGEEFSTKRNRILGGTDIEESCPVSAQVGVAEFEIHHGVPLRGALYNLVPPPGVPAEFGFNAEGLVTLISPTVRTGGDYGLTADVRDASQALNVQAGTLTFWGVPADPRHNSERHPPDQQCEESRSNGTECAAGVPQTPFLTMPTSCTGPLHTTIRADSWQEPGRFATATSETKETDGTPVGLEGCNQLAFQPKLTVSPDTTAADTPAGLSVEVRPELAGLLDPEGVSAATLKNTTVVLPQGVVINPGQAAGLQACQVGQDAIGTEAAPTCPPASKVGTVKIQSPLLETLEEKELTGNVYVLQSNPPHLQLLVAASGDGINLKLVGNVELDETTGQLTTTFTNTPPLPFTDFQLQFSGGAQAALDTPLKCGEYTTTADFTPWTSPFGSDYLQSAGLNIVTGSGGGACQDPLPFTPSMTAGASTDQAGGYANFSLLLSRPDDQQRIGSLQFTTPKGLLGMLSHVPLCPEPQAAQGECSPESQIGHTTVEAGPGPFPLVVPQPGQPPAPIYLTQGYKGAPYGLTIKVPLVVGPFTLQTQIVRAAIHVDPHTAQLQITTDPIPPIVDGIPTDLRTIDAEVNRPSFIFNPTNCEEQAFTGTATSTEGTTAPLSSRFQVGSCQSLRFAPKFTVATAGHTSKALGASLTSKVTMPAGAQGTESDITKVKVELPIQLPSQLKTLQKACLAAVFEANPANCPSQSVVGRANVITPVLPVPLEGPAYFVSHGGEEFPSLIVVLQGYGVTIDLVGTTKIAKGVTSTTFRTVPDAPFSSFQLTLPQGPYAALGTYLPSKDNYSFCGLKLKMPTEFIAQNGAEIHESTPIIVTGCSKATHKKAKKANRRTTRHATKH